MTPSYIRFTSLAHATTRYQATWLGALTLVAALFAAVAANATEAPKPARCSFLYINGDLVVSCPKGTL